MKYFNKIIVCLVFSFVILFVPGKVCADFTFVKSGSNPLDVPLPTNYQSILQANITKVDSQFVGLFSVLNTSNNNYDIEYADSLDGIHWENQKIILDDARDLFYHFYKRLMGFISYT
ncbi:MAG: hypothetical protein ACD_24C00066G0002 [uncultured bacterium]|nr:MAG: hypothetical protein ACD_24C00066G0002 [uncultured bacterium]